MNINAIRGLVAQDFAAVDALILRELVSEVELIHSIVKHILESGGKRLRPLVLLLVANALSDGGNAERHELAAIIEFIHTSTLLHDDVVDNSARRRNQPSANTLWGNSASVLAGDFLYSRAFQILARRSNVPVMKILADVTNDIAEGEVMQLVNRGKHDLTETEYWQIISRKTAKLYAAACKIGAMIAAPNDVAIQITAADYGLHLGLSFQIIDDLLDYTGDAALIGKNIGDDLAEGKLTLPLIYTLHHGTELEQSCVRQAILRQDRESVEAVTAIIKNSHGYDYALAMAEREAKKAKNILAKIPMNRYQEGLAALCDFVLLRHH